MTDDNGGGFRIGTRDVYNEVQSVKREISGLREEIAALKVRSGVWGMLGALIVVIPAALGLVAFIGGRV